MTDRLFPGRNTNPRLYASLHLPTLFTWKTCLRSDILSEESAASDTERNGLLIMTV